MYFACCLHVTAFCSMPSKGGDGQMYLMAMAKEHFYCSGFRSEPWIAGPPFVAGGGVRRISSLASFSRSIICLVPSRCIRPRKRAAC